MRRVTSTASSSVRAIPFGGCRRSTSSRIFAKLSRSSARSMECGDVPMIRTPASSSARASFSGVCPPNCTITPSGCSRSWMFSTSSAVSGSKKSRSDVS